MADHPMGEPEMELAFVAVLVGVVALLAVQLQQQGGWDDDKFARREAARRVRAHGRQYVDEVAEDLSAFLFRRTYRMKKDSFVRLLDLIKRDPLHAHQRANATPVKVQV
jgi:hypothetical protein